MKTQLSRSILVAAMAAAALPVLADDELIVYAAKDGAAYQGATVVLNGEEEKDVPASGIVKFDLKAGSHSVEIIDGASSVHSLRFDSASGQLVDLGVVFESSEAKHFVEAYSKIESASAKFDAPKGTVSGRVNLSGVGVAGATITVEETGDVFTTDSAGRFEIELPRGEYSFAVAHEDATEIQNSDVRVVSNTTRGKNFYLSSGDSSSLSVANPLASIPDSLVEEVFVTATFDPNAFGESEQFSSGVVNTLSFEDLARFSAGDVAAAVVKAPGVTVQDGKYLFIRGLGGRYITATLNGATLPSTDPNKRTVPLDLFPTNMVDQLDIKKTFVAAMPGESTGGNLIINTRSFPDERAGSLSLSVGGNSWVTNHDVRVDPTDGAYDIWGRDDGSREEPIAVRALGIALDPNGEAINYLSENAVLQAQRAAGSLIMDDLDYEVKNAGPDVSLGANYGDLFYLGDNELGVFAAVNYSNSWSRQDRAQINNYSGLGELRDTYESDKVTNNIETSGLLSLGLNVGESTFEAVTIVSRSTDSYVDYRDGFNDDAGFNSVEWTIQWEERQFLAQQLLGEHLLGGVLAKWQVTGSQSSRWAPDRREVRFDERDNNDFGAFTFEAGDMIRRYDDLVDNNLDVSFDLEYETDLTDAWYATFNVGAKAIRQERDAESRSYGFDFFGVNNTSESINGPALTTTLRVDDVLNHETNGVAPGFRFREKTQPSDSYDSELELDAIYASIDSTIASSFQVVVGVRYEDFLMETDTFDINSGEPVPSVLDESLVLPSLSLNWMYSESQQFRVGVSKTASRPDFKERSNGVWFDEENRRYRGNPLLEASEILNVDARWEWFFGDDEKLTVAAFYKDIDDAIEEKQQIASGSTPTTITFINADKASIEGIELDFKKNFELFGLSNQNFFVQGNVAYIESTAEILDQQDRELQGQPEYTSNLIFGWDDYARDQELTLLFNRNGESIRFVGDNSTPDEIAKGRLLVDLNYSKTIGESLTLGAELKNILDQDVRVIQRFEDIVDPNTGEVTVEAARDQGVTRSYRTGVGFEASVKWKF